VASGRGPHHIGDIVQSNGHQCFLNMSRLLAHVGLAVVRRTDAGDISRHVFATFAERHDVVTSE
jgi:hypothetical protein